MSKLPCFLDDTADLSIQDIQSKIKTIIFEQTQIGIGKRHLCIDFFIDGLSNLGFDRALEKDRNRE